MKTNLPKNLEPFLELSPWLSYMDLEVVPESDEDYNAWFNTKNSDHKTFLHQFAQDGAGGVISLWHSSGTMSDQDPVIYLDSEGGYEVIAKNFDDFLRIISSGISLYNLCFYGKIYNCIEGIRDADEKEEAVSTHNELLTWIKDTCGIDGKHDPAKIVEEAKKLFPDFKPWVEGRITT